jgi:tRNA(Ile)-lysidine synthase
MKANAMKAGAAQRILRQIQQRKMLRAGDRVGVAVSGGADSVALLLLLVELQETLGIVLSVVHFNHKLRGKASDQDEKFVAKLAAKHGLLFHLECVDVAAKARYEKRNLEDAARQARYGFFAKLVQDRRVSQVAVGHTADDQAETVLAHILRGTGLAGLGGIHPVAGHIVRPLMEMRRSELRAYLRSKKQSWREDATNRDTTRMRARIRRRLVPLLERQFQPAVVKHLATLAELAREDEAFLSALVCDRASRIVEKQRDSARVLIRDLIAWPENEPEGRQECLSHSGTPRALSKRLIRQIVEELKSRAGQLSAEHVESVLTLAERGETGKAVVLPGGVEVRRERDALVFRPEDEAESKAAGGQVTEFEQQIDLAGGQATVPVPDLGCVFRFRVIDWAAKRGETNRIGAVLDRDALRFPLVLRNWRPGDKLRFPGHQNAHKLKRLLNEKHISRWKRNGWPVLTSGGILAWARGFPVAAEFAVSERTRAGIVIAEEKL